MNTKRYFHYGLFFGLVLQFLFLSSMAFADKLEDRLKNATIHYVSDARETGTQVSTTRVDGLNPDEIGEFVSRFPESKDIMVSTDSTAVAETLSGHSQNAKRNFALVPLGELAEKLKFKRLREKVNGYATHIVDSARADKIGLFIVTVNTMYDSFIWMHATQYSMEARAAQMIYSVVMGVAFGIDKDSWARVSGKIRGKIMNLFKLDPESKSVNAAKSLLPTFVANFALATAVQSGRISLMGIDHVLATSFIVSSAVSVFVVSFAYTFANFSWSEMAKEIDIAKHPYAKTFARRLSEARALMLGHLAPSSKVLSPDQHGYSSLVVLGVTGVAGLLALINAPRIVKWIEFHPTMKWFRNLTVKVSRFFAEPAYFMGFTSIRACRFVYR
jgi:hypothetical protein